MVFIEPCEVEELLGSCCTCDYTPQEIDPAGDDEPYEPTECGVPWGMACEVDGDCAGNFCCRDMAEGNGWLLNTPYGCLDCVSSMQDCFRCWDCAGFVGPDHCSSCGGDDYPWPEQCPLCGTYSCQDGCTHGYACHWQCGPDICTCIPWDIYDIIDCGENHGWPDYFECVEWTGPWGQDHWLIDTTLGACCQHEWVNGEYVYVGCEEVMRVNCRDGGDIAEGEWGGPSTWWGIHTTCGEFGDCCGELPDECIADSDCGEGDCCSDFGNCVTCAFCDCQCLVDSITEWECCEETDGDGMWHIGETCESYDCEEDCPEEVLECGPDDSCPPCYSCEDGVCVPECEESADCPSQYCCEFGCCIECLDECHETNDSNCDGDQCCKNGSCTYDCPECNYDGECPGEQECEDGICVDPPEPPDCEESADCPQAQCCEDGECVGCLPDPGDEPCSLGCCSFAHQCNEANSGLDHCVSICEDAAYYYGWGYPDTDPNGNPWTGASICDAFGGTWTGGGGCETVYDDGWDCPCP